MIKNFIKVTLRNIVRQKTFSAINIFGFAIGLAVCMIISLYVYDDLSYDRFHENSKDIYRLLTKDTSVEDLMYGITSGPLVAGIKEGVPEVLASTRVSNNGRDSIRRADVEQSEDEETIHTRTIIADTGFFDVFDFKILAGNSEVLLQDPNGIYLTPEKAEQVFGDDDPIGKPVEFMEIEGAFVAGIVEAPPTNSTIFFECIVPFHLEWNPVWWDSWQNVALTGYVRLQPDADLENVKQKIIDYASDNGFASIWQPRLQKLTDIHLDSGNLRFDTMNWGRSDRAKVISTGVIALFVLFIASINFINLSSARATKRAKEVGMRKIIGSGRKELIFQFLGESLLITYFAMIIAIAIFEISIPYMNDFMHKHTTVNLLQNPEIFIVIFGAVSLVGLLAGFYPAIIISGFKALSVLKGSFHTSKSAIILRRILVVGQFAISISLISAVFIVKSQIDYLNNIDIGYNRRNVVDLPFQNDEHLESYQEKVRQLPGIESIGMTNSMPGGTLQKFQVFPEGEKTEDGTMFDKIQIDSGLIPTLKMELLYGENFKEELGEANFDNVIINETALEYAAWEGDPIGKTIRIQRENDTQEVKTVIGVVKDFNFTTTRRVVNPTFMNYSEENYSFLVRINELQSDTFLAAVEEVYHEFYPEDTFRAMYLDDIFNFQFRQDQAFASFIAVFSIIAIIISCLGLFGLSSYMTEQRTKEIGIRKVLGSSIAQVVKLLSIDFTRWVILANFIAWPLTWYAMNLWLNEFVYQMNMNIWIFLASGLIVITIALLTIGVQTFRAANANPVRALKYE